MRVFIGRDPRQPLAYNVLANSIVEHASVPVSITALSLKALPIKRRGLTEFTFSRFLVPYLCNYEGLALFLDADMVVTSDIKELFTHADGHHQVHVNKDQKPFEWASAMLFDCALCTKLTPEFIDNTKNQLFDFAWCEKDGIGSFPAEWNQICGYGSECMDAKLYHFTRGIPIWKETKGLPQDKFFFDAYKKMTSSCSYSELMGESVHATAARYA
jgi:hypothetical protein